VDNNTQLRILHLEDGDTDAELVERELRRAGLKFSKRRVETRDAFIEALKQFVPSVVLLDLQLPAFDGESALAIVRREYPEIPAIMVTGAVGDEKAVGLLKAGAADYVLKDRLARLGPAVQRALFEASESRALKQAESALRESERRFATMLDKVSLVAAMLDREGRITYANDYLLNLTRWERHEVLGKDWFEVFISSDQREILRAYFAELLGNASGTGHSVNEIVTRFEERRMIKWNNTVLRSPEGEVIGAASIGENITEQRKAEEALRSSEEQFRAIATFAQDAIITIEPGGTIVLWNEAAQVLFGYSAEEARQMNFYDLLAISPLNRMLRTNFDQLMKTGQARRFGTTQEFIGRKKDGSEFYAELSVATFNLRNDWCAVGVLRDISERARVRETLKKALAEQLKLGKLKDELVAIASHELRTPMSAIKGLTCMLLGGDFGQISTPLVEPIQDILASTERLIGLVNNVLDVHRLESDQLEFHNEEIDLDGLTRSTVRELEPLAKAKGIALTTLNASGGRLLVAADPMRVREVLHNLIGNALKFTDRGGIIVELAQMQSLGVVRIRDTGKGIEPNEQHRLFEKFQQISSQEIGKPPGTGLGLYLSRAIMEKLGGRLWLEKSVPNLGSTFAFELPLVKTSRVVQ
jgi:PAS domain S-box-containing protein